MDSTFRALLIANWEYPADSSGSLPDLAGASHDAEALKAALTHPQFGLFDPRQVTVCSNAAVAGMKKAIRSFIDHADDGDTLLLYYTGHGEMFGSHLYLGAYDTDGADVYATGLDTGAITQYIEDRNRARNMVVILDCCYAGAFGHKGGAGGATMLEVPASAFGEGQYLLASSRRFETSRDTDVSGRPSPFTEALSQALIDPQLSGGTSGLLTLQQVYDHLFERYRQQELAVGPQKKDHGRGAIPIARRSRTGHRQARNYSRLVQRLVLEAGDDEIFSVAISPDSKTLAAGTDGAVLLWTGDTEIGTWGPANTPEPVPLRRRGDEADLHETYVYCVAFSPDGQLIASADEAGRVRITSLDGRAVLNGAHHEAVYSVGFAPDGKLAATGSWDRRVIVWDVENNTARREFAFARRVSSVAFSPHKAERVLAVGTLDNSVALWEVEGGSPEVLDVGHASSVESVCFSYDGGLLASCGLDKTVRLWDTRNRKLRWIGSEHEYLVRCVAFAPDGETLVSASWDKSMKLWNAATGAVRAMPSRPDWDQHADWIWAVTFSPDGRYLASAGSDGRIFVWSARDDAK